MKIYLLTIIVVCIPLQLKSQDGVLFKVTQSEDKIYRMSTNIISDSKINYKADDNILSTLRQRGVEFPMLAVQEQKSVYTVITGKRQADSTIPFTGKLDSIIMKQNINGKSIEGSNNQLDTSFRMSGFYKNGEVIINDVSGNKIDSTMKSLINSMMNKMMKSIDFPDTTIKVGESFFHDLPISIPIQGTVGVNMIINTTYTLKGLTHRFANFDIGQKYELGSDMDSVKVSMNGSGVGYMVFDRIENQMTSMNTKSNMNMKIDAGVITIIVDSDFNSEINILVENRN